ncbi:MAG: amidase [Acidiferrobacterales bacterium]|nr:amidase [Acidiferrobacterales bacterium]
MTLDEYVTHDAISLNQQLRLGEIKLEEVCVLACHALETLNPVLNAVTIHNPDVQYALSQIDINASPISGAPFLLKDANVFSKDMPTTFSCRYFENALPKSDSEIVRRWRQAGVWFLGKSNTPEFAGDFVCEPSFRGPTRNPWAHHATTGGSSGGAAAAVASGMVPLAHATDLGGSIRIPSACCGVFGLKPTSGLSPTNSTQPELSGGLNSDHVISRTVRDSAASLDITAQPILGARYPQHKPVQSYLDTLHHRQSLKIGVCTTTPIGGQTPVRQQNTVQHVSDLLANNGHELIDYRFPSNTDFGEWFDVLWMFDIAYELRQQIQLTGREPARHELEALTHLVRQKVSKMHPMDYYLARQKAHECSRILMQSMAEFDILLTPALSSDPVAVGSFDSRTENFDYETWTKQGWDFAAFSSFCNITGQPAAALPVFLPDDEMPSSVQLAGHALQDHIVLQLAAELEPLLDWQCRRPPTWAS